MKHYLKTELIKEMLKKRGWNQKFLAEKAHISYSQLNRLMKHKYEPTYSTLDSIANALDCYVDTLVTGTTKTRPEMIKISVEEYNKLKGE